MERGYIDDFDLKRIVRAVEEDLGVEPLEYPEVAVKDFSEEDPTGHVVNIENLWCSCPDYEHNCKSEEKNTTDNKYCKHIIRVVFEKHRML